MTSILIYGNEEVHNFLKNIFNKEFTFLSTNNIKKAIEIYKNKEINLAIIDYNPEYKIFLKNKKIKTIFLIQKATHCEIEAYDCIEKPINQDEIIRSVFLAIKEIEIRDTIVVGYGDYSVRESPTKISTVLGSCVAVVLYDKQIKLGGMTHIMVPKGKNKLDSRGAKEAVTILIKKMTQKGAQIKNLTCEIYGGSHFFNLDMPIGKMNIENAKSILEKEKIKILKEDTGGEKSRKITLDTTNGKVEVTMLKPIENPNEKIEKKNKLKFQVCLEYLQDQKSLSRYILVQYPNIELVFL